MAETNPFAVEQMAAGYANARPAVHPRVLELARRALGRTSPFAKALDIGCGSGVSTRALRDFALQSVGVEPAAGMLRWAKDVAPEAYFVAGRAEAIPLGEQSVDVITAAGSLNYADSQAFFPEARRVLRNQGVLIVYDFQAGCAFRGRGGLTEWFDSFRDRYPSPPQEAKELNPEILAAATDLFKVTHHQYFDLDLRLTPEFYLDYMMTETNVAAAVRSGVAYDQIRNWCAATLDPVWQAREHDVIFHGYFACLE